MSDDAVGAVLETVPGAAIAVDDERRLAAGNESSSVVFGTPIDELAGTHLEALVADGYLGGPVVERYEAAVAADDADDASEFRLEVTRTGEGVSNPYEVQVTRSSEASFDGTIWSLTDVGTHERYAETVEALHRATRELVAAESREAVYERAGQAANEVLGFPGVGVREYDPDTETLAFVTFGGTVDDVETRPGYDLHESPHGRAFRTGETVSEAIDDEDDPFDREVFSHTMYVPIEGYGVLSLGKVGDSFDDDDRRFAEILAKNTESALRQVEQRERLREQGRRLRRQNERLEEFASIVSHDLRNPLGLARGAFETYRETGEAELAENVVYGFDRMERIVEDVLTMAREGRSVDDPVACDLDAVAREAWRNVDTGDLGLSTGSALVTADRGLLLRVFENLFRNVVEHATDASTVAVEPTDGGFAVADDGDGFDAGADEPLFELGHTTASSGTGFGLAIVEQIADAHGWSVTATAGEDGGATFVFDDVEMTGGH
jgi:signal transduction histidine kinase